jgi:hypothetical protein
MLQRVARIRRYLVGPDVLNEPVRRHRFAIGDQQSGEDRALSSTPKGYEITVALNLKRSEHSELHDARL